MEIDRIEATYRVGSIVKPQEVQPITLQQLSDENTLASIVLDIKQDHYQATSALHYGTLRLYLLGEKLLQIRQGFQKIGRKGFGSWLSASFPEISYSSLLNYMALARVRRAGLELDEPIDVIDHPEFKWATLYELGRSNLDKHQSVRKMFIQMMCLGKDLTPEEVQEYKYGLLHQEDAINLDLVVETLPERMQVEQVSPHNASQPIKSSGLAPVEQLSVEESIDNADIATDELEGGLFASVNHAFAELAAASSDEAQEEKETTIPYQAFADLLAHLKIKVEQIESTNFGGSSQTSETFHLVKQLAVHLNKWVTHYS